MSAVWAGIIAAVISWVINGRIIRYRGNQGMVKLVPAVEEAAKTFAAVLLGGSIFLTHAVFGTVEAVYDTLVTRKYGVWAGLISYLGHMLFGWLTMVIYQSTGYLVLGLSGGYLAHLFWNWLILEPKTIATSNGHRGS